MLAPSGTAADILGLLNAAVARIMQSPEMRARMAKDGLVPVGGTREPLTNENKAEFRLQVADPEHLRRGLEDVSLDNFVAVVEEACARSGITTGQVAYAAVLHMKRSAHEGLLARLGIPAERSIYLQNYGHIGQVDPLLSLKLARDQGRLKDGDVCVLMAAGVGYVWNALCVRYRAPH